MKLQSLALTGLFGIALFAVGLQEGWINIQSLSFANGPDLHLEQKPIAGHERTYLGPLTITSHDERTFQIKKVIINGRCEQKLHMDLSECAKTPKWQEVRQAIRAGMKANDLDACDKFVGESCYAESEAAAFANDPCAKFPTLKMGQTYTVGSLTAQALAGIFGGGGECGEITKVTVDTSIGSSTYLMHEE